MLFITGFFGSMSCEHHSFFYFLKLVEFSIEIKGSADIDPLDLAALQIITARVYLIRPELQTGKVRVTVQEVAIVLADNGRTTVRFSRVARNNCPPQFFVDGVQVSGFSIDDMPAGLAAVVNLERVAVRLVLHDNPAAAIAQCVRQDP